MRKHISPIAKQRISDFFTQEDGNVGRKNALTAGTILSSVMLAATLFVPETANANDNCPADYYWCGGDNGLCCKDGQYCCSDWYEVDDRKIYFYFCTDTPCPPQQGGG